MYILYDQKSPIRFRYRGTKTVKEIAEDPELKLLLHKEAVLFNGSDGETINFVWLDALKRKYEVTTDDPEQALAECIEKANEPAPEPMTVDDLFPMLDDLGTAMVEQSATNDEVQDQIDLIAGAVEELIAITLGD